MRRYLSILFVVLFSLINVSALFAGARIKFSTLKHDFGTIQEKAGDATYVFKFKNAGDSPLLITRATSSCGCTTPNYTKKPIKPGDEGEITVTYHAKGRPGPFEKSIYVFSNDSDHERVLITISGNVVTSRNNIETYNQELGGGIRVKITTLNFFDVYPTRKYRTRTLMVYNEGDVPVKLETRGAPKFLRIEADPSVIEPKKEGSLKVTYLADKVKDWGPREDFFYLLVKGKEAQMKNNRITIQADIWEDFSSWTKKDLDNQPEIDISETNVRFQANNVDQTNVLTVRNCGKSKLSLRKLMSGMPECLTIKADDMTLKPGQSTTLFVKYDHKKNTARKKKSFFYVMSNDPSNSRVVINVEIVK